MGAQNHRPAYQTDRSITVILPVLNGAAHLAESLRSISGQSARDIKVLVLDGGSQDATCRIVSALAAEDDRISLVELPDRSLVERLNIGIAMAKTRLIARMDADDVALPTRLDAQRAAFAADQRLVLLGSATAVINEAGSAVRTQYYPTEDAVLREALLETCPFSHPAIMFSAHAAQAAGGYRAQYEGAEDHDLWLRLSDAGRIRNLAYPLLRHRRHDASMSARYPLQQAIASAAAVEDHLARSSDLPSPWGATLPAVIGEAFAAISPGRRNAFCLNAHRSLMFGDALRSKEGRIACENFVSAWCPDAATAQDNRRFAEITLRGAAQAWRFSQRRLAKRLALLVLKKTPQAALRAVLPNLSPRLGASSG